MQTPRLKACYGTTKKQTADRIIRQLKAEENQQALALLSEKGRPVKQQCKVWEDGYNTKALVTEDFLRQKMGYYIHNNPCQPHWTLSNIPEAYLWSSARFYHTDQPCIIPIDDVRKIGIDG